MAILGSIPSTEEVITNATILGGQFYNAITSAPPAIVSNALADLPGGWVPILAGGIYPAQYVTITAAFPITIPVDCVAEIEYGYGIIGAPTSMGFTRFRRVTTGAVVTYPLAEIPVLVPRVVNAAGVGLFARIACSVAGPQGFNVHFAVRVYPVGV